MNANRTQGFGQNGFSLVELAVVLSVVAVLVAAITMPLGSRINQARIAEARSQLLDIREALFGFAVIYGRLPCPSRESDPSHSDYGIEDFPCAGKPSGEGFLPWRTLGMPELDPWGQRRVDSSSPWLGYWRYRTDRAFVEAASSSKSVTLSTTPSADALVIDNHEGRHLTTIDDERPIAVVYSTGPDLAPNGQNASFEASNGLYESGEETATFDDQLIWITRPLLFSRMIAAQKLPKPH